MTKLTIQPMVKCPRDKVETDIYGCRECCEHYVSDDESELDCGYPNKRRT